MTYYDDLDDGPQMCLCGCGGKALPGREVEAAQLAMMKSLTERLEVVTALEDHRGGEATRLRWSARRAIWGLDGYAHADESKSPIRIGKPMPPWIATWRKDALNLLARSDTKKRRWKWPWGRASSLRGLQVCVV